MLKIGFAEGNITPQKPVWLEGQFYQRKSEYVETPVMVNVMAVESDCEQFILCSCDLCMIHEPLVAKVRFDISKMNNEIDVSKIIMFATHTHTSILYGNKDIGLRVAEKYLPEGTYCKKDDEDPDVLSSNDSLIFLAERISNAIVEAWNDRKEALQSREYGNAVIGHCRRVVYDDGSAQMYGNIATMNFTGFEGGSSSDVELLYVFDTEKKPMGVLVNIPCPSQVVEMKSFVSSDYWGKTRDMLKKRFGNDFCIIGMCSAAGDQAPRDITRRKQGECQLMSEIEGTIEIGKRISDVVINRYQEAQKKAADTAKIIHKSTIVDFPLRKVTPSEYQGAQTKFNEYVNEQNKSEYTSCDMRDLYNPSGVMKRYEEQRDTIFYSAEVHVVRFGDIAIATSPFELFLDYGLRIKAQSPAEQTFLIQLACDSGGYLPTEKAEKGGSYSAFVASGKTGHEGGDLLVRKTLKMLDGIWKQS